MPEQIPKILRLVCVLLAAIVVYQVARVLPRVNILGRVVMPELPTLPADKTNSPTNGIVPNLGKTLPMNTNKSANVADSNLMTLSNPKTLTNSAVVAESGTNLSEAPTNGAVGTNLTNFNIANSTNLPGTNLVASTNLHLLPTLAGTNGSTNLNLGTNAMMAGKVKRPKGNGPPGMMMAGMGFPGGAPLPELPPEIKARVDRIYESEILAQAMRPQPMGLLGIAGDVAFLRSANGQTGMVKEGDMLGDLKLVQIGINRVLVEQGGQKKELMIFDGYGGTSLLPEKGKNPE